LRVVIAFLAILTASVAVDAQEQQHFFPERPNVVKLRTESGILTSYGVGNDAGGFKVGDDSFALGYPLTINGVVYRCLPTPTRSQDDGECKKWPRSVRVGKSRVRVTYWFGVQPGVGRVKISNEFSVI